MYMINKTDFPPIQIFDVVSMETPTNLAYSPVGLPLHIDLSYYESPPGLQFLHCIRYHLQS